MLVASPGMGSPSRKLAQFFRYGQQVDGLRWQLWMPSSTRLDPASPWHGLARPGVLTTIPHPAPALLLLSDAADWQAAARLYGAAPQLPRLHLLWGADLRHWGHGARQQPAVRAALGSGVALALEQASVFREPIHALPMGLDPEDLPPSSLSKSQEPVILARHQPALGLALQQALLQRGIRSRCELTPWPERQWHAAVAQASVAVVLSPPPGQAGLGLRRLAAMALGTALVCDEWRPDDGLCRDGRNARIRTANADDLAMAVAGLLEPSGYAERDRLVEGGKATLLRHRTALERLRFQDLLEQLPEWWQQARACHPGG
jgi:hypothetical protein